MFIHLFSFIALSSIFFVVTQAEKNVAEKRNAKKVVQTRKTNNCTNEMSRKSRRLLRDFL